MSTLRGWQLTLPSLILSDEDTQRIVKKAESRGYTVFVATQGSKLRVGIVRTLTSRPHAVNKTGG